MQQLIDVGCEMEEGSNMSLEREGAIDSQIVCDVPPAALYCQDGSNDEEDGGDGRGWQMIMRSLTVHVCLREHRRKVRGKHNPNKAGSPV